MSNTDFDPNAYLGSASTAPKQNAGAFNPDTYLAASAASPGYMQNLKDVAGGALSTINDTLNPFSEAYIENAKQRALNPLRALTDWTGAVSGLAAIPQAAFSPLTAAVKTGAQAMASPFASAVRAAGEPIAKMINPNAVLPTHEEVTKAVEPGMEQALALAVPSKAVPKTLPPLIPTTQQLYDAADGDYAVARAMNVNLHPQSVANFARGLQQNLETQWFRDYKAPDVFNVLKELQSPPPGSAMNIADIDGIRKLWGDAAGDFTNPTQQRAASQAIRALDDYVRNVPQSDVLSGDAQAVQNVLESARGNYAAAKRSDLIESQQEKAQRQAGVSGSGANITNAMRQKMNQILNNKSMQRGFSPDELDQIRSIAMGTPLGNLARKIGKLAPTGVVSSIPVFGSIAMGEPTAAIATAAVGHAGKVLGELSTARGIEKLSEGTRARSPLAAQLATIPRLSAPRRPLLPVGGALSMENAGRQWLPGLQSPTPAAAATPQQQGIPGPGGQQKHGGAVGQQRATGGKVGDSGHKGPLNRRKGQPARPLGARLARDGKLYVKDARRPGKFLMVVPRV